MIRKFKRIATVLGDRFSEGGKTLGHNKFWTMTEEDGSCDVYVRPALMMVTDDSPANRYVGRMRLAYDRLLPYLRVIGREAIEDEVFRKGGDAWPWKDPKWREVDGIGAIVWEPKKLSEEQAPTFEQFFQAYGGHDVIASLQR